MASISEAGKSSWDTANVTAGVISEVSSVTSGFSTKHVVFAVLVLVATLLGLEQVSYRRKMGGLPGAPWTIPVIG